MQDTIYGAVHKHQQSLGPGGTSTGGVFGMPVILKYTKVPGPVPSGQSWLDRTM